MKLVVADIGHSGEMHKLYTEYCNDVGLKVPNPDFWLWKFHDPSFFLVSIKHGRRAIAFMMGYKHLFYDKPTAHIEAVFIKRAFRGKIKTTRKLVKGSKDFLKKGLGVQVLAYTREKAIERRL